MNETEATRKAFERFCGPAKYRRFRQVLASTRFDQRLRFWQEDLIARFNAHANAEMPIEYRDVCETLSIRPDPLAVTRALVAAQERMIRFCSAMLYRWQQWRSGPILPVHDEDALLRSAYASSPWLLRWLNLGLPVSHVDRTLHGNPDWDTWKADRAPGDKVLPFVFNEQTLAMREGYVIVRLGKPYRVILTAMS